MKILSLNDHNYPYFLKHTEQYAPDKLYYDGDLPPQNQLMVAVVGTRNISEYGREATKEIVSGLVEKGFWIVSGMAHGIDSAAHEAAINAGGKTIAVLGTGLDAKYFGLRGKLRQEIPKHGCVITEYPLSAPVYKTNFPERNRIIAGLSIATVIVEASSRSGSFITALWSHQIFNRDVFAVPGSIFYPRSQGTHIMIQKNIAFLATSAEDICEHLAIWIQNKIALSQEDMLSEKDRIILNTLSIKGVPLDEIIERTKLPPAEVSSLLSLLELRGLVRSQGSLFALPP